MMSQLRRPLLWNTEGKHLFCSTYLVFFASSSACMLVIPIEQNSLKSTKANWQKGHKNFVKTSCAQFIMYTSTYYLASKINPHFLPKGLSPLYSTYIIEHQRPEIGLCQQTKKAHFWCWCKYLFRPWMIISTKK